MSGDLAEKVSRAMCCGNSCLAPDDVKCCHGIYKETAKAAIRVVVEECAQAADDCAKDFRVYRDHYPHSEGASTVAAAILALLDCN